MKYGKPARISTEFEILICDAIDHIKQLEIERLDDCGRVTSTFECEEQDEMDAFTIAGNDLERIEEFRKAVRSYREEERWVS